MILHTIATKGLFFSWMFSAFIICAQQKSSFHPGQAWYDEGGSPINAHAGGVLYHEGIYYWYGQIMTPGSQGSDALVGVSCYSSEDLYTWKFKGVALEVSDDPSHVLARGCKVERPKVIYNRITKKFVMWWHHDLKGQGHANALTGIATSERPGGPYTLVRVFRPLPEIFPMNVEANMTFRPVPKLAEEWNFTGGSLPQPADSLLIFKRDFHTGQMSRDMTLFVDEDNKAYHIYASEENSTMHIAELSEDYLGYSGKYIRIFVGRFMEAPTIFKRNGVYYMINSGCTGWVPNAARSAKASSIWGPWIELGNPCRGDDSETTFNSQGTYVLSVSGVRDAFIFMADRWSASSPDRAKHVWLPILWDDNMPVIRWFKEWNMETFKSKPSKGSFERK